MKNFKIIIEHDFFSRKPIFINFNLSLVEKVTGDVLHHETFKCQNFKYGLLKAMQFENKYLQPKVILALITADISQGLGFEIDKEQGLDKFFVDVFRHLSTDELKEYVKITKDSGKVEGIINELKERGELT